jgi:FixJ family two-component response regulator
MAPDHIVFIVDDDRRIRESLTELLSSFDMHAVALGSAAEYLAYPKPDVPACLILDMELPDINGLELQSRMAEGHHPHIVFITGHGDIPSTVRAIKAGAVDFLAKPFKESDLMRAIAAALEQNRDARRRRSELAGLRQRFSRDRRMLWSSSITAMTRQDERSVMSFAVRGAGLSFLNSYGVIGGCI